MIDQNSLVHVGILGMHWGVRRGNNDSGSKGSAKVDTSSKDHTTLSAIKKKKLSELSNDDIRAMAVRMQLEKDYKTMTQTTFDKRKQAVMEIVGNAAKQTATQAAAKYMSKGVDLLVNQAVAQAGKKSAERVAKKAMEEAIKRTAIESARKATMKALEVSRNKAIDAAVAASKQSFMNAVKSQVTPSNLKMILGPTVHDVIHL